MSLCQVFPEDFSRLHFTFVASSVLLSLKSLFTIGEALISFAVAVWAAIPFVILRQNDRDNRIVDIVLILMILVVASATYTCKTQSLRECFVKQHGRVRTCMLNLVVLMLRVLLLLEDPMVIRV